MQKSWSSLRVSTITVYIHEYSILLKCAAVKKKVYLIVSSFFLFFLSLEEYSEIYAIHLKAITEPATVRYADFLRAYYKSLLQLPKFKWPMPPSRKPFNLQLVSVLADGSTNESESVGIQYLLRAPEGKSKLSHVLLEGDWGVGKTCLAIELCKRWEEIASLRCYSLVVLLRAEEKGVQDAKTLTDIFIHHNSTLQHDVAREVTANSGESLLLIIDSADRLLTVTNENSILLKILKGSLLPKCTVLLLCWKSFANDVMGLCGRPVDRRVELIGFTEEEIEQHAEAYLGYNSELLSEFHDYLSATPAVMSTMHVPFHTAIAVEAFKQAKLNSISPPSTLTEMYTILSSHLLQQHMLLQGLTEVGFKYDKFEHLPPKTYSQLCNIAKLSYTHLSFGDMLHCKLPKGCYHMGFMVGLPELYVSRRRSSMLYSYLHLYMQEYLAAFHISRLQSSEQLEVFHKHVMSPSFNGVWRFLSGMTQLKAPLCREVLAEVVKDGTLSPTVLQCLYEAHKHVPCEQLLQTSNLTFPQAQYGEEVTPLDCYRLGCCLAHSSCNVCLQLRLNSTMLHHLLIGLQSSDSMTSSVHTLFLRPPITQDILTLLHDFPHQFLRGLDLSHCELNRETVDHLATIIPRFLSLQRLDIRGNPIGAGGLVKLLHSLTSLNLETLNIINVGLGCSDITALSPLLSEDSCLHHLSVGDEGLPDDCLNTLIQTTLTSHSLHSLHLWLLNLKPCVSLLSLLLASEKCHLNEFELHGCKFGEECCQLLSKGLTSNTSLTSLILSMFDVPSSHQLGRGGAEALADMIKLNATLENLQILFDRSLCRSGAEALVSSLKTNKTLKILKLPQQHFTQSEMVAMDKRIKWSSP